MWIRCRLYRVVERLGGSPRYRYIPHPSGEMVVRREPELLCQANAAKQASRNTEDDDLKPRETPLYSFIHDVRT